MKLRKILLSTVIALSIVVSPLAGINIAHAESDPWASGPFTACLNESIQYPNFVTMENPAGVFSISAGVLPTGLTLNTSNGQITGTPTVAYSDTFTVTSDAYTGSWPSHTFTATISACAAPTITDIPYPKGMSSGATNLQRNRSLLGSNFRAGVTVTVGGVPATIESFNATSLVYLYPDNTLGAKDVVVTNRDGQSATVINGFTYVTTSADIYSTSACCSTPISSITAQQYQHYDTTGYGQSVILAIKGYDPATFSSNWVAISGGPSNGAAGCLVGGVQRSVWLSDSAPISAPAGDGVVYRTMYINVGTVSAPCAPSGNYTLHVHVDSNNISLEKDFSLSIGAYVAPPTGPDPTTSISIPSLAGLTVGSPIVGGGGAAGAEINANGTSPVITVSSDALIPDLAITFQSGKGGGYYILNGTPSAAGTYSFTVTSTVSGATPSTFSQLFTGSITSNTRTVTYQLGGGTGTTPTQAAVAPAATFTVASIGAITRVGFQFAGWSDGVTTYASGSTYTMGSSNVTLTAQWTPLPMHTITFNANGGTGSMTNQISNISAVISANLFTRPGFTFHGWWTTSTGGTEYDEGDSYSFTSDITLYVEWSAIPTGGGGSPTPAPAPVAPPTPIIHSVTFNGNGATGGNMAAQLASFNTSLLPNQFVRLGFNFDHWSTVSTVDGTLYDDKAIFPFSSDVTLYAHWSLKPMHSVTFLSNGGVPGGSSAQTANQSTQLTSNSFARAGYSFTGWASVANGAGLTFADAGAYDFAADLVLYAQWLLIPIVPTVISESAPLDLALLSNESKTLHVAIPAQNGTQIPATIDVPSGIVGVNGSIRITPVTSSDSLALGIVTIKVEILDSFGSVIPTLLAPMTIHFKNAAGENIVAQSNDGFFWTAIPKLSGTTLPSGVTAGYYLDSDGAIVILTSHLTQFGLKRKQIAPFQVTSSAAAISNLGTTSLTTSGGSGSGAVRFSTSTPSVCTVDTNGILIPVASGKCLVSATKGGDAIYLHSDSSEIGINISSSGNVLSIKGSTTRKSIFINLSAANSGKTVSVQVKTGTLTTFKTVSKLVLNELGRISSTVIAPKGSTIRVMVGSKVYSTLKVVS